jgi:hypothetical protein
MTPEQLQELIAAVTLTRVPSGGLNAGVNNSHLTDIQEPDCYVADMIEKELREKVSDEKTKYGLYNKNYIHTEDSS